MRLALSVAWRFTWKGWRQSLLIVLGIGVGISVLIFIGSLIKGLQESLIDVAIGRIAHISISSEDKEKPYLTNYQPMLRKLDLLDNVKVSVPTITVRGYLSANQESEAVNVKGFELIKGDKIYQLGTHLETGRLFTQRREVVIGKSLAEKLDVAVGDTVKLKGVAYGSSDVEVVGVVDMKNEALNKTAVYISLATAQQLFSLQNHITSIDLQVYRVYEADETAKKIASLGQNFDLKIDNWKNDNASLLSGLRSQTFSTLMIQFFVLLSVVLGIASLLAVSVMQKSRQIGILKAMGMTNSQVTWLFIFQGAILSAIGIILGIGIGLWLIEGFLSATRNSDNVIKIVLDWLYIGQISLLSFVMACISVAMPARRVRKMDPIEVIRNG